MSNMNSQWLRNSSVYRILKASRYYDYVTLNRDAWIKAEAGKIQAGARVLDVGAGSCPYRRYFAHCDYKTQDFVGVSDEQLRDGGYGQIDYISEILSIPVPAESFDCVLCTEVLEHVPEPIQVVQELNRVLRVDGCLLLSAPLGSGIHQEPFHFYGGYTPFWYERYLKQAGFSEITVVANAGLFKRFGWESVRFMKVLFESFSEMPWFLRYLAIAAWLASLPLIALLLLFCDVLDPYDKKQYFTAGYHVRARKVRQH